jgi:hypothetical protein
VKAGQSYEISNSGKVLKAEGDSFIRSTFKIGTGSWAFETETLGQEDDRAQMFTAGAEGVTAAPVVVRRVTISIPSLGKSSAATRRAKRAGRLRFFGRVAGPARVGARVFIQIRDRRNWRKVGSTKVGVNGRIRFHRWTKLNTTGSKPRARAMVRGIGRSRPVRVAVRH